MNATNIISNTSTDISNALLIAPFQLNIWFGLVIFVTGNISTFGNFFVFTSRTFRARACSVYLIAESVCTFIYFNYVLVTRMIQKGFQLPIINRYDVICKIRQFLSEYTHQVAFTFFALATMDRLLSTHRSVAYRQWSNRVSLAYKLVPAVVCIWFLLVGHRLVLYSNSTGSCRARAGIYEKCDSYFEVIMSGFCPPIVLITLGCLLLKNVRKVAQKRFLPTIITPQTINVNQSYIQQIDAQLTMMILMQSFVAIPSFIPFGAQNLYSSVTENWYKPPPRLAWENVIIETIRLLSYVFYNTSFYISLLCSRGFRKQVLRSLGMRRYAERVHPVIINIQAKSSNTIRKTEQRES